MCPLCIMKDVITFNSMAVEDNHCVYEGEAPFLRLPTIFGKSVRYKVLSFACSIVNKASWVQGGVATFSCYIASPLVSLTIAKFIGLSEYCIVVALYSNIYMSVYYSTWTRYISIIILQNCSGNGHACTSSRYQAVFLQSRPQTPSSHKEKWSDEPSRIFLGLHTLLQQCHLATFRTFYTKPTQKRYRYSSRWQKSWIQATRIALWAKS